MRRPARLTLLVALLMTGCSSSPTNPLGIFPEGQQMLKETREARRFNPEPWPMPRELAKAPAPPYVVEQGDILLVQPTEFDSPLRIPGDQPVLPDGSIHLGRFGRLLVAGLTVEQIEDMVRERVRAQIKDAGTIIVRVVSRQSKVYYVLGEVNAPGSYPLQGRETVLDAILAAGGINSKADLRKVTLTRPSHPDSCRTVLPVCYEQIVQLGDTSTNYQIQAGDRIFIPSKSFFEEMCHHLGLKKCPTCARPQIPCTSPACPVEGH